MKTRLIPLSLCVAITFLFFACDRDDPDPNPYDGCCGNTPVEFSIPTSGAHVYVPNVFTPNADGINDLFLPLVNEFVVFVNYMVISQDPDNGPPVLYQVQNVEIVDLWTDKAWDGRNAEGELHKGKFTYEISFETTDDQTILVHGFGCSILCDDDASIFNDLPECYYPIQVDNGHLDPTISHQESGCFH